MWKYKGLRITEKKKKKKHVENKEQSWMTHTT